MKRLIESLVIFSIYFGYSNNHKHKVFYVHDKVSATKIAKAVWFPMYGFTICHEKPYVTTLIGDSIWHVEGSMKESRKAKKADDSVITVYAGGVAEIDIRKDNGSVLKVYHGK